MALHIVHTCMHRELLSGPRICPVQRKLFWLSIGMGLIVMNQTGNPIIGVAVTLVLYALSRWITVHDPKMMDLLLVSHQMKSRYDPAKHRPVYLKVVS